MGTNYYARIIPSKEKKDYLKKLIDSNDFRTILSEVNKVYGRCEFDGELIGGEVHLGKRSGGWKFLWNPNIYLIRNGHLEEYGDGKVHYVRDPDTTFYLYPLTKKGIKDFIDREDIEVYNEYGEKQDKDEFFKMALEWTTWNGEEAWDSESYNKYEREEHPERTLYRNTGEYVNLLIKEGFCPKNEYCFDFYSDGLRFSTSNEFS